MPDHAELIARLEAATEGSSSLDRAIRDALGLDAMLVPPDGGDEAYPYTTSIDCALTLVPDDWTKWELSSYRRKTRFRCELSRLSSFAEGEDFSNGHAPTPALALCIAALRARAA